MRVVRPQGLLVSGQNRTFETSRMARDATTRSVTFTIKPGRHPNPPPAGASIQLARRSDPSLDFRVHTYFTSSSANHINDAQINDTQLVLVPPAKFGHLRLLPTTQASTPGLAFPHCQSVPQHGYLCPGAGLPSMDM